MAVLVDALREPVAISVVTMSELLQGVARSAATAITHGFGLATRNSAEFGRVPGLRLVAV